MDFSIKPDDYFDHPYNSTSTNERCIEVPIGIRFLNLFREDNLIEVGAVLPHYVKSNHDCIDPVDPIASKKEYAENINYTDSSVLSISTIEHIGHGDYGLPKKENQAQEVLLKIYKQSSKCLISWPVGYNRDLDSYVKKNSLFKYVFHKRTKQNEWVLSTSQSVFDTEYGTPFHAGNAIIWVYKNL